jgi:trk system potassium uptake protein TrkH
MTLRPILYIVGLFLLTLAAFMCIPMMFDIYASNMNWRSFAFSVGITGFIGGILTLSNKQNDIEVSGRGAFLLTALAWLSLCFF